MGISDHNSRGWRLPASTLPRFYASTHLLFCGPSRAVWVDLAYPFAPNEANWAGFAQIRQIRNPKLETRRVQMNQTCETKPIFARFRPKTRFRRKGKANFAAGCGRGWERRWVNGCRMRDECAKRSQFSAVLAPKCRFRRRNKANFAEPGAWPSAGNIVGIDSGRAVL